MVSGTVSRITPYGAFLTLEGGKVGLVHISEIDRNYVRDVHDHLREDDVVQAKVIAIKEDGKIDLSIKALQDPPPQRMRRGADPDFEARLRSSCARARSARWTSSAPSSTSASSAPQWASSAAAISLRSENSSVANPRPRSPSSRAVPTAIRS